jgi:guanylate kinase
MYEAKKKELPYPKIGDVVRYFDVDGGQQDGEVLLGKISLVQSVRPGQTADGDGDGTDRWLVEINRLEDVGEGYYAEYPSRKRREMRDLRKLEELSPVAASYVRTEDAFMVPTRNGRPVPQYEGYKLVGYGGPAAVPVDEEVLKSDMELYNDLKFKLLRDSLLAGVAGALLTDLVSGLDNAIVYFSGAIAGVGYLFFLSVKTDTVGAMDGGEDLGKNVSNVRFVLPLIVLVGVALRNLALGDASPLGPDARTSIFSSVTTEQFAAAMLGFLTYRIPLFIGQLAPLLGESAAQLLPGSAGMALQMAQDAKKAAAEGAADGATPVFGSDLTPVLLVCGPSGTGKTTLVQRLIQEDDRFVAPTLVDRIQDPANFERLESKKQFLTVDDDARFGLTAEGVLSAASDAEAQLKAQLTGEDEDAVSGKKVVVVDADVSLAKKLTQLPGSRLIGVWVGLDKMDKFEGRLEVQIESGDLLVPDDETKESVVRAKIKDIVQDIEYGVVSGLFEFTILNDDLDSSLAELKDAAEYCF